jgi:hypothetical protein
MSNDLRLSDAMLSEILRELSRNDQIHDRDVLWDWYLSRVERVNLGDSSNIILKRSRWPLVDEGRVFQHLSQSNIPLPNLYFARVTDNELTLLMEDLGPIIHEPTLEEAAEFAVRAHAAVPPEGIPVLDEEALRSLPEKISNGIETLTERGRWHPSDRLHDLLEWISRYSSELSQDAAMPPFGLCHSEYHPTSLHIGTMKTALVDWARAFIGPGLLDLASWFGTFTPPDSEACRHLIELYVEAGGDSHALSDRGSLPAEDWAFFWHRIWVVDWFVASCLNWTNDESQDHIWQDVVERHLEEAHIFLP